MSVYVVAATGLDVDHRLHYDSSTMWIPCVGPQRWPFVANLNKGTSKISWQEMRQTPNSAKSPAGESARATRETVTAEDFEGGKLSRGNSPLLGVAFAAELK